jgi:hypothetical protein
MARFAILMLESAGAWSRLPEAEQARLLRLYGAWVGELRASGSFVDGWPFGGAARVLRGGTGGVTVSADDPTRPAETGLFLVEAPDLDAATKLARGCPALLHGETVIVRPVGHD